jgi:hypothetical protein
VDNVEHALEEILNNIVIKTKSIQRDFMLVIPGKRIQK